jgi:hypothetical protein
MTAALLMLMKHRFADLTYMALQQRAAVVSRLA